MSRNIENFPKTISDTLKTALDMLENIEKEHSKIIMLLDDQWHQLQSHITSMDCHKND